MHRSEETIENEALTFDGSTPTILGPGLVLKGCQLTLRTSQKNLVVSGVVIEGSSIQARAPLKNFKWCEATIRDCRFTGHYIGCDFGRWPEFFERPGEITDSDFSGAILEGCRFLNCDVESLRLPRWPSFTILQPAEQAQQLAGVSWPGSVRLLMGVIGQSPRGTSAVTEHAPSVVKRRGGTEAELRAILEALPFVLL